MKLLLRQPQYIISTLFHCASFFRGTGIPSLVCLTFSHFLPLLFILKFSLFIQSLFLSCSHSKISPLDPSLPPSSTQNVSLLHCGARGKMRWWKRVFMLVVSTLSFIPVRSGFPVLPVAKSEGFQFYLVLRLGAAATPGFFDP